MGLRQQKCFRCGYPYKVVGHKCPSCGYKESCFITTAACETRGLPDDCVELTVLREFRDTYMVETAQRRRNVEAYYQIAPGLVDRIDRREDRADFYEQIRTRFIAPAVAAIQRGEHEHAEKIYESMVRWVESRV